MTYIWHGRTATIRDKDYVAVMPVLPGRYGQTCRMLVCGRNRKCVVEFSDKKKYVTMTYYLRKEKKDAK